mmetsp:Transcript_364/g.684  ORF Transcript_364/g.684 Transcript_364/m.684 type:complete len:80 (-) Transcript_364:2221-2460(-)
MLNDESQFDQHSFQNNMPYGQTFQAKEPSHQHIDFLGTDKSNRLAISEHDDFFPKTASENLEEEDEAQSGFDLSKRFRP